MILKCSHCGGMMKVAEESLPRSGKIKVQCPHCKEIDPLPEQPAAPTSEETAAPPPTEAAVPRSPIPKEEIREPEPGRTRETDASEPSVPADAFRGFRFPAEKESPALVRKKMSSRIKLLIWAAVSLLIVVFFALLVNILLPGPYGGKPVTGLPTQEQTDSFSKPGQ
jgi:predicted Zn finger-like uncharacterized protein